MPTRYRIAAIVGLVLAIVSALSVALHQIALHETLISPPHWLNQLAFDFRPAAHVTGVCAAMLATMVLFRRRGRSGRLLLVVATVLVGAATYVAFAPIFRLLTPSSNITASCLLDPNDIDGGCLPPDYTEYYVGVAVRLVIATTLFAVAAVILGWQNRAIGRRSTIIRLTLLLLAAVPVLNVLGLIGTRIIDRLDPVALPTAGSFDTDGPIPRRLVAYATVGTGVAAVSTVALLLFALEKPDLIPGITGSMQEHAGDAGGFASVAQLVAILLCAVVLVRARTLARWLVSALITMFAGYATYVAYSLIGGLTWDKIEYLCYPANSCGPDLFEGAWLSILTAVVSFAISAALIAVLNRPAPTRDTALRIGLVLLAALPFVTLLGLVGTLLLARRDASVQQVNERELIDA